MTTSDFLIRSKLRLPFVRPGLVARPRLQEKFAQGLLGPLTLVAAPAGFGKTTLVASCVAGCGMTAAWLSLDKNDNQPGRFMTYLVAALQAADLEIGKEASQLIAGVQPAPPAVILTSVVNDIDSVAKEMVLVLDDYQFINSQAIHEAVAFLLEHCPVTFHLVIATRSDPQLPLARMRARGQMIELRSTDLRFTVPEATSFLNVVMGLHLDHNAVTALEDRTEGWVAGLQMASLALQGSLSARDPGDVAKFIQGFSGTNRYILDYLLEEVLANQPEEIQAFLLRTAILERLSAPLCDALLAGEGEASSDSHQSDDILSYLERENIFLVPLEEGNGGNEGAAWYRYHHLFADLLFSRLRQDQPDLVTSLHVRASVWLEEHGFIAEAVQHLITAGENERAADLIERYGPARWAENDQSVIQLSDSLPPEMLLSRPRIGACQAWILINQGVIEKALPLLTGLERRLASGCTGSDQQWICVFVHLALLFLFPPPKEPGLDPFPDPKELDEFPPDERVLREAAEILYGMALGRWGDVDRAITFGEICLRRDGNPPGALTHGMQRAPTLVSFLSVMYWFQGRLREAAALSREYLEAARELGILASTAGNLDVVLGQVMADQNCLEEAERFLRNGLRANEPWGNIMTDAFGLLALVNVLTMKGDYAGALETVEKFEARLQGPLRPVEFWEDFHTAKVRVQLASGDLRTAVDWADRLALTADFQKHRRYYLPTLARIRLAQGKFAEVEQMLAGVSTHGLSGNRVNRQLEHDLLLAAAIAGQQRLSEALQILDTCLTLAEPEGYLWAFLDIGEPIRELLVVYLRSPAAGQNPFAQKVLGAFPRSGMAATPASQPGGLVEPLSERECEVLQLLSLGKTNQEIAQHLFLAPGTVKAHTANIYRKLDVANRTEAVARARVLGILS